jgi:hydroxymethylbilane synthase
MIADQLMNARPGLEVRLEIIRTLGDAVQDRPLAQLGRTGVFTAELERALLDETVDFAVHSLKDLPTLEPPELSVVAIPPREDPRDALVLPADALREKEVGEQVTLLLPPNARVGTSSLRRRAQLLHARPDLDFRDLRGNVDTRLRKLDGGEFDACIFAAAGLKRLGLHHRATLPLHPLLCTPDPGQGALAIQIRSDRDDLRELLSPLNDPITHACVTAERTVLARLGGGCSTPVGALAVQAEEDELRLMAVVAAANGESVVRAESSGFTHNPEELGARVAGQLMASGAGALLTSEKGIVPGAP